MVFDGLGAVIEVIETEQHGPHSHTLFQEVSEVACVPAWRTAAISHAVTVFVLYAPDIDPVDSRGAKNKTTVPVGMLRYVSGLDEVPVGLCKLICKIVSEDPVGVDNVIDQNPACKKKHHQRQDYKYPFSIQIHRPPVFVSFFSRPH